MPPYPEWSQSDDALASTTELLRGLHDAASGFAPRDFTWNDGLADPESGAVVCHNDVCLENVVFRDGVAVALLDFEFAAPGRPISTSLVWPACACRSITTSTKPASDGALLTDRRGCGW